MKEKDSTLHLDHPNSLKNRFLSFLTPFYLFLLFGSCNVGPKFNPPNPSLPSRYLESGSAVSLSDPELITWWKSFNDPSLNRILEEALSGNLDLSIACEKILQARSYFRQQTANLLPEVQIQGRFLRYRDSQTLFDTPFLGPPQQNLFQIGFDTAWELDLFGKLQHGRKAAFYEWQASIEDFQQMQITVLSEVASVYAQMTFLKRRQDIYGEIIRIDKALTQLQTEQFESGLESDIEVKGEISSLEEDRAFWEQLHSLYKQNRYQLAFLLGKDPEFIRSLETERPILQFSGKIPAGLPSELLRRRPDIRSAERTLAAATEKVGVAVADLFPQFSLTNLFGYQSSHSSSWLESASRFWALGASFFAPLFDFGRRKEEIQIQTALQSQAFLVFEKAILEALKEVESALITYFAEENRSYRLYERKEATAQIAIFTQELQESGLSSGLEVLKAQKEALVAEDQWIDSQMNLSRNLIALYKSLGGDWACSYLP
jgi:outer membrane protein, multidrug efflux system